MKKLLLTLGIFSIVGISFAERYPIEFEYSFMQGCSKGKDKLVDYCACGLRELEATYTLQEFLKLYSENPNEFKKEIIPNILKKCIDKYPIE